jgi:hypothetical protein
MPAWRHQDFITQVHSAKIQRYFAHFSPPPSFWLSLLINLLLKETLFCIILWIFAWFIMVCYALMGCGGGGNDFIGIESRLACKFLAAFLFLSSTSWMDAIECKCFFLLLNERRHETPLSLSLPNTRERACQPAFYLSSTELKQGEDQLFSQTWVLLFNYHNRAIYSWSV